MARGLTTTFNVLAATANEAAVEALVPALDSPHAEIQLAALRAIFRRRSAAGHREVIRRLHVAGAEWREVLDEFRGRWSAALRDAVLCDEPQTCRNACQAILWFGEYDLMPALITAAEDPANPAGGQAAATLLELADTLYHELAVPRDYQKQHRDPQLIRRHVLSALELSVPRWTRHKRREIVEAIAMLAKSDSAIVKQVLRDPHDPAYLAVLDVLTHSPRPGVMRLVLSFLDDPTAPSAALGALAHRRDRAFVEHLLRKIGNEPAGQVATNLKRIDNIVWLRDDLALFDALDEAGQHGAVQLLMASGLRRLDEFRVLEHALKHGKPAGRVAAAAGLARHAGTDATALVLAALEDADPRVQAQGVAQLRQHGIPSAMAKLVERLDSPHEVIRQAARGALSEFSFERFLNAFEMLDDEVRQSTGALVRKIDRQTVPALAEELRSPSRYRRMRGIGVAVAVDAMAELEDLLIELVRDEDHMVRVAACGAIKGLTSTAVREALYEALRDRSQVVREAAQQSLEEMPL